MSMLLAIDGAQEDIMEFVNSIANIVHMEVALHEGAANKNIGDAFLLVWKFPPPPKPSRGRLGSEISVVGPSPSHAHR